MKLFFKAFNFYINASLHVALSVLALFEISCLEYELHPSLTLSAAVFFGSIFGYNFVKYIELAGNTSIRNMRSLRSIMILSFISLGLACYFALNISIQTLIIVACTALLTFFYAIPLLNRVSLRSFSGLKIFIVAIVWAGVTVLIPWSESQLGFELDITLSFLQRFFIVIALTIPFEIRDLNYDISALRTLPQQFGVKRTKLFGLLLLLFAIVLEGFKDELTLAHMLSLVIICLVIALAVIVSKKKQLRYFSSFWVEGIPILWLALLLVLGSLF